MLANPKAPASPSSRPRSLRRRCGRGLLSSGSRHRSPPSSRLADVLRTTPITGTVACCALPQPAMQPLHHRAG